ncbi:WcaI family glycosyltransferase [Synechococcales cyanobacterium C]|uniref:WcaI family glycosyltransferase n=1 Tax=Petrachloros mirabilis ULC683 TaxID=2781853 RepID=A0A8K1ZWG7_9CYAN|nr:WcaI family glycosyltransferase [Petrachloros mirabilis]NCJ06153.1 WcaI family glycosyltransferase [Petrachloros mirabilis ULC683]
MRLLIYGLNYAPEIVGIGKYNTEMAEWFVSCGHQVSVVCAPPYYPKWSVRKPFKAWQYHTSTLNQVAVNRCPLWVPQHPSGLKRLLHLLSFALCSLPMMLWQVWKFRPDLIFVIEPPIFCLPIAILMARLRSIKLWLHIQDFEIDAGFSLGLVPKVSWVRIGIQALESRLMRCADGISTISAAMLAHLQNKQVAPTPCLFFPNWVSHQQIFPISQPSSLRQNWGIPSSQVVCLYAGSLGQKHNLEILADAAEQLRHRSDILIIIVGQGAMADTLAARAKHLPNLQCYDLVPPEKFNDLLNLADLHLLPQSSGASDLVMPSKLQAMFASGRPVIATTFADTHLGQTVQGHGLLVPPHDPKALAVGICTLADNPWQRMTLGAAARQYAITHWDREHILLSMEQEFLRITTPLGPVSDSIPAPQLTLEAPSKKSQDAFSEP